MKTLNTYITEQNINEGFKDSIVNIFNNLLNYGQHSKKELVTIEIDPKVFGKLVRDKKYFEHGNGEYPKIVPTKYIGQDDLWHISLCELGENKYGDETTNFTDIGYADFRKDKNKIEVDKQYQELVENIINKYK